MKSLNALLGQAAFVSFFLLIIMFAGPTITSGGNVTQTLLALAIVFLIGLFFSGWIGNKTSERGDRNVGK